MECTLLVQADHGDCGGSINGASLTTNEKLTKDNLPKLEEVKTGEEFVTTQSWAWISWNSDGEDGREDEEDEEDEEKEELAKGLGIRFHDEFGSDDETYYASFYVLHQDLLESVEAGVYVEKIHHNRDGTTEAEFVYYLDTDLFKRI